MWWHNRDLELGNASNNTPLDADLYVENDGMWLWVGGLDNSNNYYNHQWHWGMDGMLDIPSGGDIRRDGVSVLSVPLTPPTPNIEYTGTFLGYPDILPVTTGKNVIYTANGSTVSNSNLYWWDDQFYDGDYDLSGATSITLSNIGGITGGISIGSKSLNLLTNVDLGQVAYVDGFYTVNLPALETFSANNLAHINGNIRFYSMDNANSVFNFPNLRYVKNGLQFDYNNVLTTFPEFSNLKHLDWLYINNNDALANNALNLTALTTLNYMYVYNNTGLYYGPYFPVLTTTGYIGIYNNDSMFFAPSFPALVTCTSTIDIFNNAALVNTPVFTNLQTVNGNLNIYNCPVMTDCPTFANLVNVYGNIYMNDNTVMNGNLSFESLQRVDGGFYAQNCALTETDVDYILHILANLDGTDGTTSFDNKNVYLDGGTNSIPSAAGLADAAILTGRGCTVLVNS